MGRIEASFPDSEFRVGIRSSDGTHRSFFSGFGVPSWNTEFRWDASKLLFRIRSSELEYGVPMGRIEASFPDSEFRVGIRSSDGTHRSFFSGFGVPSWNTEFRWDASKLLFRIRSSELEYGVPMGRIEASFPDSEFRVGIRSSDGTHQSFFSGFGVPSWNMEFRWDASKLLFRIRSSELEYGVPMGRIEASFPDSEFRVRFRSSDASHLASRLLPGGIRFVRHVRERRADR